MGSVARTRLAGLSGRRLLTAGLAALPCAYLFQYIARYGYYRIFSVWALYDDEGYVMQSVLSYLQGHRLYDEVFSQYGPAFYLLHYLSNKVLGIAVTHDTTRLITLGLWLATAVACGGIVFRLTRSIVLTAVTFVHVFVHIAPLINEPGHPETLLGFTFSLACLIAVSDRGQLETRQAVACGTLAAIATLTKINVGGYLLLGLVIPLICATTRGRFAGPVVIAAAAAIPFWLMRNSLQNRSAAYAVVVAAGAASTALTCHRLYQGRLLQRSLLLRTLAAFTAASVVILAVFLVQGTTPSALADAILIQPLRLAEVFYLPLDISRQAALVSLAALPLAIALTSPRLTSSQSGTAALFATKAALAAGALCASRTGYLALIEYVTPFLWVLVLPVGSETPRARIGRGVLAATATFECLQGYPVGGTQVPFGTLLMAPAAFVCLHDAMRIVAERLPFNLGRGQSASPRISRSILAVITLVWAVTFYRPVVGIETWRVYAEGYRSRSELRLAGASRVRLLPLEVARLHWLTGSLRANCSAFVSVPGFQSFHVWSGVAPLLAKNAGTWMTLFPAADQARLWQSLDQAAAPCGVLNETVANNWLGTPVAQLPAYRELTTRFHAVDEVDGFRFMLPNRERQPSEPVTQLVNGVQGFTTQGSPLPVVARFLARQPESSIRTWIRTTRSGVVLGCQRGEAEGGRPSRGWPLIYVGTSGKPYAQHLTAGAAVLSGAIAINDGEWHHLVLVRRGNDQSLFVDGRQAGTIGDPIVEDGEMNCQAGTGFTTSWPDVRSPWMRLRGEIDGLAVVPRAWSADDVGRDLAARR
jgi:hypothetical protein